MNASQKSILFELNRWNVLMGGIVLSFIFLMVIPEKHLTVRSISITLIAVLSISYYLYKRYSKRFTIQADLLISANTFAQFLLPVFYLTFYYNENPHLDFHGYRYGYAITSFAALIGQSMFFMGYESMKRSIYFPRVQVTEKSYARLFLVMLPLITVVWISRIILLYTGSYYHIYRTDYQFTSPFYSVFAQISGYGIIVVVALFLIAFSEVKKSDRNSKLSIAVIVTILELLWHIPSGSREPIALTVLAPVFAYIVIKRSIPKKTMITLIIISFPMLAILGTYRYVAYTSYQLSRLQLLEVPSALIEAKDELMYQDTNIVAEITDRFYDGKSLGYLLMHYSHDYDYEMGRTYEDAPFTFIPRFFYPEKPVLTTPLNNWYRLLSGGSMPTTFWGESYINFSWFGIILMSYALGFALKGFDYIFIKRSHRLYWIIFYTFCAIHMIRLPMQPLAVWISFMLKVVALAFIFTQVHSGLTRIAQQSGRS